MREVEKTYGCFRCGVLQGPLTHGFGSDHLRYCGECGERGIVSFKQALDMLNDLHRWKPEEVLTALDLDEYYIEEAESD